MIGYVEPNITRELECHTVGCRNSNTLLFALNCQRDYSKKKKNCNVHPFVEKKKLRSTLGRLNRTVTSQPGTRAGGRPQKWSSDQPARPVTRGVDNTVDPVLCYIWRRECGSHGDDPCHTMCPKLCSTTYSWVFTVKPYCTIRVLQ